MSNNLDKYYDLEQSLGHGKTLFQSSYYSSIKLSFSLLLRLAIRIIFEWRNTVYSKVVYTSAFDVSASVPACELLTTVSGVHTLRTQKHAAVVQEITEMLKHCSLVHATGAAEIAKESTARDDHFGTRVLHNVNNNQNGWIYTYIERVYITEKN